MKNIFKFTLVVSCFFCVFSSCGKENGDEKKGAYLEGIYSIQELETTFHTSEYDVSQVWYYDYEKKELKINGQVPSNIPLLESLVPDAMANYLYKYFVQNYVIFPNSIVFQKDGTISRALFDEYIDDVGGYFTGKYDLKSGSVSISYSGIEGMRYKVISDSDNSLKLECSEEFLAFVNKLSAEEGKSNYTIIEKSKATFKKVAEVSPF